ncbi:MAG: hypothetical protein IKO93_09080, partial [Lentisphaeria bacterium]|nr:hypothetical protein [Lentisphaeria bacterium]
MNVIGHDREAFYRLNPGNAPVKTADHMHERLRDLIHLASPGREEGRQRRNALKASQRDHV